MLYRVLLFTGQPYYPPAFKAGHTKINATQLLQQIGAANAHLHPPAGSVDNNNPAPSPAAYPAAGINKDGQVMMKKITLSPNNVHGYRDSMEERDVLEALQKANANNVNKEVLSPERTDTEEEEPRFDSLGKFGDNNNNNFRPDAPFDRSHNNYNNQANNNNNKKQKIATAPPRPPEHARDTVDWFEEYRKYALRASVDLRFRIRHAPVPLDGSPWPLPQTYHPSPRQLIIHRPSSFLFNANGESCDILTYAFERARRNTFGDASQDWAENTYRKFFGGGSDGGDVNGKSLPELLQLNVTVVTPCSENSLPHLNMNEACKYCRLLFTYTLVHHFMHHTSLL